MAIAAIRPEIFFIIQVVLNLPGKNSRKVLNLEIIYW